MWLSEACLIYKQPSWAVMLNKYFRTEDEHEMVDIYEFFNYYNAFFFEGVLERCFVEWSERMTLCAGTCAHSSHQSCTIRLSAPILKYRTANELKETLLHEMIHAFLFLTNPRACLEQEGHGPEFQAIMRNINSITGLNITIYHQFHNEVNQARKHVWRCNGACRDKPPFYGYVKRAMNRKPQPADHWFNEHRRTCGGEFQKVSEPQKQSKEKGKKGRDSKAKPGRDSKEKPSGKTIEEHFKQMGKKEERGKGAAKKESREEKKERVGGKEKKGARSIVDYMQQMREAALRRSEAQQREREQQEQGEFEERKQQ